MDKKCYICKKILTSKTSYKDISKKNMLMSRCKKCHNKIVNERRKNNGYYKSEAFKKKDKIKRNSINGKYRTYIHSAKIRNYEFNISKEEFIKLWQKNCYYCGDSIETIGIDRVDNKKGYTINNIVSCCGRCNIMKNTMEKDEFIKHCNKIVTNFNSSKN